MLLVALLLANCCLVLHGILAEDIYEECGGILTEASGVIRSPDFPNNYPDNTDCYWLIRVQLGHTITLTTAFFDTQLNADYLDIRDGVNVTAPQLGHFSGNQIDEPEVLSTHNTMWLYFHTSSSTSYMGFELYYTTAMTECHAHYTEKTGVIHSPKWPEEYPNNAQCTWTITIDPGEHIILTTTMFDTQLSHDYLEIRDGKDSTSPSLLKWSGEDQDVPEVVSSFNDLYIHFNSDAALVFNGFELNWTTKMTSCHAAYTEDEGVIHSPGWPGPYPNNAQCFWTITVSPGERIYLNTTTFDTEGSTDFLKIWDGPNSDATLLANLYGVHHDIPEIVSSYNQLALHFESNKANFFSGFEIFWSTEMSDCHHHFTANEGTLHSPGWPGNYPNNAACTWTITVTPGDTVTFTTDYLDTEGSLDYLEVFDGPDSYAPSILKVYGRNQDVTEVRSSHHQLYVHFISDAKNTYKGFQSFWTTNITECHADYITSEGSFHSPGFPGSYPNNAQCAWTITVPSGETIKFNTLQFDTATADDYLQVFDGPDAEALSLLKWSGQREELPEVVSSHNQLYIQFTTNGDLNDYKGFQSTWTTSMTDCHAEFTDPIGVFHSPRWPQRYSNNANCSWTITSEPWSRISIHFTVFDTEDSTDYLQIWDGPDASAPSIANLFGRNQTFDIITSSYNQLYLNFITNSANAYDGFECHWTTVWKES